MNNKEILKKYINTKKQPTLLPYLDDIKFLFENDASQLSMLEYLKEEKNVTISPSALSNFIKKYIKKTPYTPKEKSDKSNNKKDEKNQDKPQKLKDSIFDD
ncbi:hypothetical protein MNB_SV-14-1816 [hydrothermal vent metagenome]|uniref:Uncharacterized protein n=1 Tax=hydrothermal vent metagenome TaxID=652676 RepID=A0A1W1BS20_9ZZZZ